MLGNVLDDVYIEVMVWGIEMVVFEVQFGYVVFGYYVFIFFIEGDVG